MLRQVILFNPSGVGYVFVPRGNRLKEESENDMHAAFLSAIKMYANHEQSWQNNIEYISWIFGFSVFSSSEGKFTLVLASDKNEEVDRLFKCAEHIRMHIIETWNERIDIQEVFCDAVLIQKMVIPLIEEILRIYEYLPDLPEIKSIPKTTKKSAKTTTKNPKKDASLTNSNATKLKEKQHVVKTKRRPPPHGESD
jgi:hypothetical protein